MPTIIAHAVVPLALAVAVGGKRISHPLAAAGMGLAMLPDADVIGFALGIDYAANWGHRGATHSLLMATVVAAGLALCWKTARSSVGFLFLALAMASHGMFDMLTDGGLGVAVWWPLEGGRHFWPVTPIRVSPIGAGFFSARGLETLLSELVWVGVPCSVVAMAGLLARRGQRAKPSP